MDTFFFAINSIMPIILVILLGYILKQVDFLDANFLKTANKLVFRVALPTYLFYNIYSVESFGSVNWGIVLYSTLLVFVIFAAGIVSTCIFTKDNKKRGALLQCVFRSNFAIIGVTLAESMGGTNSVAAAAVISAFSIPLFNILAVISLSIFNEDTSKGIDFGKIIKSILKNPLIRGVCLGIIVLLIRGAIPVKDGELVFSIKKDMPFLYGAVKNVGAIASPLALIVLGGQFKFSAVRSLAKDICFGVVWRLIIAPIIGIGGLLLLSHYTDLVEVSYVEMPAVIALYCTPVAVASAIMAEEMNSHGELARQLVVWTSLISIFTMFIAVVVLRSVGVL